MAIFCQIYNFWCCRTQTNEILSKWHNLRNCTNPDRCTYVTKLHVLCHSKQNATSALYGICTQIIFLMSTRWGCGYKQGKVMGPHYGDMAKRVLLTHAQVTIKNARKMRVIGCPKNRNLAFPTKKEKEMELMMPAGQCRTKLRAKRIKRQGAEAE